MPYDPDTTKNIFDRLATTVLAQNGNANPRAESTMLYATLFGVARTLAVNQEQDLAEVDRNAFIEDATGDALTKKARNLGVRRDDPVAATGVVTFSRDSRATTDYTIPEGTVVETVTEDPVQFETTETATLTDGTQSVKATVEAVNGGTQGNVGARTIQAIPSPPTGIEEVENEQATGDPTLTDTNGDPLVAGEDRETDSELRERVLNDDALGEGPDADGVKFAVTNTTGVLSTKLNTNQQSGIVDGLDPYHSELIVYGGAINDIAETLVDVMSVPTLLRLQGGVNGTKETTDRTIDLLEQTVTIPITRPTELTASINIDVVHTDTYVGDDVVKDTIVEYIGGTKTDGKTTTGLLTGENVLINEIENRVEDRDGVEYADVTLIDTNDDGTDDSTTDSDGVPVLSVSDSEVSRTAASDIVVSTTAR